MRNPKSLFIALAALLATPLVTAQTPPQAFSYQALVRDGAGAAVRDQRVGVQISLRQDSANAFVSYMENFAPFTNGFGNINLSIGRGNVSRGTFAALDWSRPVFIEVGVDITGGSTYTLLGATQLMSVPYALYAGRSATTSGISSEIRDGDGNTRVSTERSPNENIIRFDINGMEKMRLTGDRLEFVNIPGNSIYIGDSAGASYTFGNNNLFIGYKAGRLNTSGYDNTFIGYVAGTNNTWGTENSFSGNSAGYSNTSGSSNTFSGFQAGYANTLGSSNTFSGTQAGYANTMGGYNTFSGFQAGYFNTTGVNNTFSGSRAGYNNTTGLGNVYIGFNAGPIVNESNKLYINTTNGTPLIWGDFAADSVRIDGGMSVARSISATAFNVSSDRRLKENIRPVSNALDGVGKINGVYYNYKAKAPDGNPYPAGRQIGVIAQDVEMVYPELVATQPGGYKAVDYPKLTAVLIEAVKELNYKNEGLGNANAELKSENEEMKKQMGLLMSRTAKVEELLLSQMEKKGNGEKVAKR